MGFPVALFVFELESLVCGVAPTSVRLITGRAVAGMGPPGIISGVQIIVSRIVPLAKRPMYMGLIGAMLVLHLSLVHCKFNTVIHTKF
jgi:MFS family permease